MLKTAKHWIRLRLVIKLTKLLSFKIRGQLMRGLGRPRDVGNFRSSRSQPRILLLLLVVSERFRFQTSNHMAVYIKLKVPAIQTSTFYIAGKINFHLHCTLMREPPMETYLFRQLLRQSHLCAESRPKRKQKHLTETFTGFFKNSLIIHKPIDLSNG